MPRMFNHELFLEEFTYGLRPTRWWDAFAHATRVLGRKGRATVVEMGCIRKPDDWAGSGQSTEVWEWLAKESGGLLSVHAVTDDDRAVTLASDTCPHVESYSADPVEWMGQHTGVLEACDLLYLNEPYATRADAALNAAAQLSVAWPHLPPGAMVMVDADRAEHIVKFMADSSVKAEVRGDVYVWRKP